MLPQPVEKSQNRIWFRNAELIEHYAQGFKKEHWYNEERNKGYINEPNKISMDKKLNSAVEKICKYK